MVIETENYIRAASFAKKHSITREAVDHLAKRGKLEFILIDGLRFFEKNQPYEKSLGGRPKNP